MDELKDRCPVLFQHIRGHSGHMWNGYADQRAKGGAKMKRSNSRWLHPLPKGLWDDLAADPANTMLPEEFNIVESLECEVPLPPEGANHFHPKEGWQS